MEDTNDARLLSMLGEMNNKISDISMILKDIQERTGKNFTFLAENQISVINKLEKMESDVAEIKFRTGVLEAGVSLNAGKIANG